MNVTVTVCNYNGAEYLDACLGALLRQTIAPSAIVLYDNASTDDSIAMVEQGFPQVEIVSMGANDGPCPARNRGLEEAATPWVLQIDSDVILAFDCLERLVAAAQEGDAAICMPRAVFDAKPDRIHYDGGSFHYVGVMTLRHFFAPRPDGPEEPSDVDAIISMALLVDRARILESGGYHAGYFILFEDHDLSYRLRAEGHRLRLVPAAIVRHREGTAGISYREGSSYPARRAYLHSRNRWMLLLRNHSSAALLLGLPGILLYEGVWFGFALLRGNLMPYLRGKGALLRGLPALLRERRVIQARRKVGDSVLLGARDLTHAPMVKGGALRRAIDRALSLSLRCWWRLVHPLLR